MVKFTKVRCSVVLLIDNIIVLYIIESNNESFNYSKGVSGEV